MNNRRLAGGAVLAVILVLVVVAIAAGGSDDHENDASKALVPGPSSILPPATAVRVVTTTTATSVVTPPTTTTSTTAAVAAPPALAPCASYPGTDLYFVVCGPTAVKAGDEVMFDLVAKGHVRDDCGSPTVDWGDGDGNVVCAIACESYPADERTIERKLQHAWNQPGAYTVKFTLQGCGPEYRPQAELTLEVQVS